MKSVLIKLIAICSIVLLILVGFLIDLAIANSYKLEVVSVERLGDPVYDVNNELIPINEGIADGITQVRFVIKLSRNDKPISGHTLYIKTNRNVLARIKTDDNGMVSIDYKCYKGSGIGIKDIILTARDEDNSIFVSVPAECNYTLKMRGVVKNHEGVMLVDELFKSIGEENE